MNRTVLLLAVGVLLGVSGASAQWNCFYATWDNDVNGTGHNTTSVGVIQENIFVALVMTPDTRNFMIPYINADSGFGRVNFFGYGSASSGIYQLWDGGFDQVFLNNARALDATSDGRIFVANNDANHNILVFALNVSPDTILADVPHRIETGANGIFGIHVSEAGYVFVCNDTSNGVNDDVKIYKPVDQWVSSSDAPMATIDLPDGIYKGITTSPDAQFVFVSDYGNRKILKYVGSPASGYTLDNSFNFMLSAGDTTASSKPSVLGLSYLSPNNILFAAVDAYVVQDYTYGRIYLVNPVTGALVSQDTSENKVDAAAWNFEHTGAYNDRGDGTQPGNASGYTSTYSVDFDENGNLYSQSHYGWTIEKWGYNGTLPTIDIGTSVKQVDGTIPSSFTLRQNFPNPFNPSTKIEFSVPSSGHVSLNVFNLLGEEVATLVDGYTVAGTYQVNFDARNLPSGTYLYTLKTEGFSSTKKMLLLR
jgi:Secretion system C-terminal sorting domain